MTTPKSGRSRDLLFGVDPDEVKSHLEGEGLTAGEKVICVCGHPVKSHQVLTENHAGCFPARMYCPCRAPMPVASVSDTRFFKFKTRGWGPKHALSLGLFRLNESGGTAEAIGGETCFQCSTEVLKLIPTSLTDLGTVSEEPRSVNALLCDACWDSRFK